MNAQLLLVLATDGKDPVPGHLSEERTQVDVIGGDSPDATGAVSGAAAGLKPWQQPGENLVLVRREDLANLVPQVHFSTGGRLWLGLTLMCHADPYACAKPAPSCTVAPRIATRGCWPGDRSRNGVRSAIGALCCCSARGLMTPASMAMP